MTIRQNKFRTTKHNPALTLKKLTDREKLGKIFELVVTSPLKKVCGELDLTVVWSGQTAYKKGVSNEDKHEPDFKIYYGTKLLMDYEVKNWRLFNGHKYTSEFAQTEVNNRYEDSFAYEHGLIISFYDCFSNPAQQKIEEKCHQNIIEADKLVGAKDFRNRELFINLYNQLKANLTACLDNLQNYLTHVQTELTNALAPYQPHNELTNNQQTKFGGSFFSLQSNLSNVNTVVNTDTVTTTLTPNNTPKTELTNNSLINSKKAKIEDLNEQEEIDKFKKLGLFNDYGFSS